MVKKEKIEGRASGVRRIFLQTEQLSSRKKKNPGDGEEKVKTIFGGA